MEGLMILFFVCLPLLFSSWETNFDPLSFFPPETRKKLFTRSFYCLARGGGILEGRFMFGQTSGERRERGGGRISVQLVGNHFKCVRGESARGESARGDER